MFLSSFFPTTGLKTYANLRNMMGFVFYHHLGNICSNHADSDDSTVEHFPHLPAGLDELLKAELLRLQNAGRFGAALDS